MKVIAIIQADLETTPLGTRSRLADELAGVPVLRRTVDRLSAARRIDAVFLLCPLAQRDRCTKLVEGSGATVRPYDAAPPPWARLVQTARKWSLDGWRGGLGGTTHFDEFADTRLIEGLLKEVQADAVLSAPAGAALIDPGIVDRMIEHYAATTEENRLVFTQAPPGVTGLLLSASVVGEFAKEGVPIGWAFNYKPDTPQRDLIFQSCCLEIPVELRYAVGRVVADTDRSMQRIAGLLREHDNPDAVAIGRWLSRQESQTIEPLPREVEIELTTDDPYPDSLLRPRGSRVESRGPIEVGLVTRIVEELVQFDDSLVVLGGFGDPLRHPKFGEVLSAIRSVEHTDKAGLPAGRRLYGLAVRTSGVDLTDACVEAILACDVDVLNVTLDAWTPDLYGQLQSPGDPARASLENVRSKLDRFAKLQKERGTVKPAIVPEICKSRDNVGELDDFHDGWLRRFGAVAISGHCHYAGQCEDRSVINMAPAHREPCRRIRSRCMVLADGRVVMCDQDLNGKHALGRIGDQSLESIWHSAEFTRIRKAHRAAQFDPTPLCAACAEWHRP